MANHGGRAQNSCYAEAQPRCALGDPLPSNLLPPTIPIRPHNHLLPPLGRSGSRRGDGAALISLPSSVRGSACIAVLLTVTGCARGALSSDDELGAGFGGTGGDSTGASGATTGESTGVTTGSTATDGAAGDAASGMTTGMPEGGSNVSCDSTRLACGDTCVDTSSSDMHCGGCDMPCSVEAHCQASECVCNGIADRLCDGECVSPQDYDATCAMCASTCPVDQTCEDGACECAAGTMDCGSGCVDTESNVAHCGGCDPCDSGETCLGGVCSCNAGTTICGEACVDTGSDNAHCGECDQACAGTLSCVAGVCDAGGLNCDPHFYGGHTYLYCKVGDVHETWENARTICQSVGLDLAVIETSDEQLWLRDGNGPNSSGHNWVGLQDLDQDGEFHWIVPGGALEGPVADFTGWTEGWGSGEPEAGDYCIRQYVDDFRVYPCASEENFFCESY
jgi:hypothetical protein